MKQDEKDTNVALYNLGNGQGTSVLELKSALEKTCGFEIPHVIRERRLGDVDTVYADCSYAKQQIKWTTKLTIEDACRDTWNWQKNNPYGFKKDILF